MSISFVSEQEQYEEALRLIRVRTSGSAAGRRLHGIDSARQKMADDFMWMMFDTVPGDFDDHVKSTMAEYTIGFMTAWAEAAQ